MCFIKCIKNFLNKEYTEQLRAFIRSEKYRSVVMTFAKIQPFSKKYDIKKGCFDGTRINPQNITQKNISLFIYNIHFCLILKSNGISLNGALEGVKLNSKIIHNVLFDELAKSFVKYE